MPAALPIRPSHRPFLATLLPLLAVGVLHGNPPGDEATDSKGIQAAEAKAGAPSLESKAARVHRAGSPVFASLGRPVLRKQARFEFTTQHGKGPVIAWLGNNQLRDRFSALMGIRTDTGGLISVDLDYGGGDLNVAAGKDGAIYALTGTPPRFVRYDPLAGELADLEDAAWAQGLRANPCGGLPWHRNVADLGKDGCFYAAINPGAILVACDTRDGQTQVVGPLPKPEVEGPVALSLKVSDDGTVYCAVGNGVRQLWSYDPRSGDAWQILPEGAGLSEDWPTLFRGEDGHVFGNDEDVTFRCHPDRIEVIADHATEPPARSFEVDGKRFSGLDELGRLVLTDPDSKQTTRIPTEFPGRPLDVATVLCERDGNIYGCTQRPAHVFQWNTARRRFRDLGPIASGEGWVLDAAGVSKGILMSSGVAAQVDLFDPARPVEPGVNPRNLGGAPGCDLPQAWCEGKDGMLYAGVRPREAGKTCALLRVDPVKGALETIPLPVEGRDLEFVEAVPQTGELFCTTSLRTGSKGKPGVFLWDLAARRITHEASPLEDKAGGERKLFGYGRAVRAGNGHLYGVGWGQDEQKRPACYYYVYDPVKRATLAEGRLETQAKTDAIAAACAKFLPAPSVDE